MLASKKSDYPIMKYYPATPGGELKDFVVIETTKKADGGNLTIERHNHVKEASLFASQSGVPLLGANFTKDTFKKFVKNSGDTETFSKSKVMDLVIPGSASFYKLENK